MISESTAQVLLLRHFYPMSFRHERLKTFIGNWDNQFSVTPTALSQNGFYFHGNAERPDCVKCFYCDGLLYKWTSGDNVAQEHARLKPYCPVFGAVELA